MVQTNPNHTSALGNVNDRRLLSAQSSTGGQGRKSTFAYDPADNLTTLTTSSTGVAPVSINLAMNIVNQITTRDTQVYSYDLNGNLTDDGSKTYQWDAENRLIKLTDKANTASTVTFKYDGLDRRLVIATPLVERRYLWCGDQICQRRNGVDGIQKRYHGELDTGALATGYQIRDHLGSVHGAANAVSSFTYDPYGRFGKVGTPNLDFRYAGMYYLEEAALNLTRYRAYDPTSGRWLNRDPIEEDDGINLYGYVGGNVVNAVDPLGLKTTLITTHDYGIGSHSAIIISTPGQPDFLYDPAGSYSPPGYNQRGSGDFFEGQDASIKDYSDYQKSTGSDVSTTPIPTTPEQEKAIKERAENQGGAEPPFCATSVSLAIGGACGIKPSPFPGQLERNAKKAKCK